MGKYFKYAIGEILLVVIGILIALQINNWNQKRQDSALAKTYVNALVNDLKKDTTYMKGIIEFLKEKILGKELLLSLKNKDVKSTKINDSIYTLFYQNCLNIAVFRSNQNTLTQLKNTGNLRLFNQKTRERIIAHEAHYEGVEEQGEYYKKAYDNNRETSNKILDYTTFKDSLYFIDRKHTGKSLPKANFENNLNLKFFNRIVILKATIENYSENYIKQHLEITEDLIGFLNEEYNLDQR